MSPTIEEQIEGLKHTIAEMEAQRASLGDAVVDAGLLPFKRKLDELVAMLQVGEAQPPAEPAQQRKLVTLLFMDIAGSTAIAQHMDPEDVREVFDIALKKLALPVEQYGGRVTRFMGDGFLSIFGAPTAREDDPEQAVRAGLQIIELASELAPELEAEWDIPNFQVRVGINTGLVALGGLTEAEDTLMGAAVNLAARLESAAPAGGLLISHNTYRHVRGVFDVELLDHITAKGFDEPVTVYRVLSAKPRAFRVYTRGVEGIETHMVGRETEIKYLQDALLNAIEEGEGQMVTIVGDAGVGKSRLLYEFQDWIDLLPPPAVFLFEGRGRQEAQLLPYALLRDLFAFRFQIQDNDSAEIARQKLETGFAEVFGKDQDGEMRAHLLGQWLGYDFSASPHLKGVLSDAEQLRNRGLMYLGVYFREISTQSPVVIFLEDIHWADDSSLDALNWIEERLHHQRLLIICATRPTLFERRPYWGEGQTHHTRLDLRPLSRRESRQLVAEILRFVQEIPAELRELVVEGAEGNPFYVEELIKMLVEEQVILKGEEAWYIEPERLAQIEVPPTLAGVLQARLDSLPPQEKVVLQQASVVGRLFWDRVVAYVQASGDGGAEIVPEALNALRGRELIYRREETAFAEAREYIFKHDILREVTYESVLKRLRKVYHGLVADWLITHSAGRLAEYTGMIAEHLLLADRQEQACEYFIRAGEVALGSFANGEAETHFRKALELQPDQAQRAACLAGLGETLGIQGSREEADQTLRQAIELYHKMGEPEQVANQYVCLAQSHFHVDYQRAWAVCQEGLARLEGVPDSPGMARLLAEAGRAAWFAVQPTEEAVSLCTQAIAMSEYLGIVEPRVEASITLALTYEDAQQAIDILRVAVELSEAHRLLRTAGRANVDLGYFYDINLVRTAEVFQHARKAAEIARQMGDIDRMIMALANAVEAKVNLGQLSSVEDFVAEFLQQTSATESQVNELYQYAHAWVSLHRGEWKQSFQYIRTHLAEHRHEYNSQDIANFNLFLANVTLEMNRFAGLQDFTEAEAALLENIATQWLIHESRFLLAIISARKGFIQEARERLSAVLQASAHFFIKVREAFRLQAEAEISFAEQNWDQAISSCQALIDIYLQGGYRWKWARHLIDLGDAHLGRGGTSDRAQAEQAYRQSLEMFTEMGATGYVKVLEERLGG
jgi:class 3 adenylate cyclase/tetratricopeptide (TPR) repeat protein